MTINILRIAAFADAGLGGNPAGVMIADSLPDDAEMQHIAVEPGSSIRVSGSARIMEDSSA